MINKKLMATSIVAVSAGAVALLSKSSSAMKSINQKGIDLIKSFEGLRLTSYLCPAGVWTIGYGHTHNVREGQTITEKQAETLLRNDIAVYEDGVRNYTKNVVLNTNRFSALVSFAFNCGLANLKSSTLLKKVKANPNDTTIRDEFNKWVYANKVVMAGLQKRRKAEADLYFS